MNKNFFSNINSIRNDKNISDSISFQQKDINKYEKEIKDYIDDIDEKHRNEITLINKIREINEDEANHIDNIICNELEDKKKDEYQKKREELFRTLNLNIMDGKKKREEILDFIKKIEDSKEEIRKLEYSRSYSIFKELEKARNNILIGFSDYIYDNEKNKKLIDILNEKNY